MFPLSVSSAPLHAHPSPAPRALAPSTAATSGNSRRNSLSGSPLRVNQLPHVSSPPSAVSSTPPVATRSLESSSLTPPALSLSGSFSRSPARPTRQVLAPLNKQPAVDNVDSTADGGQHSSPSAPSAAAVDSVSAAPGLGIGMGLSISQARVSAAPRAPLAIHRAAFRNSPPVERTMPAAPRRLAKPQQRRASIGATHSSAANTNQPQNNQQHKASKTIPQSLTPQPAPSESSVSVPSSLDVHADSDDLPPDQPVSVSSPSYVLPPPQSPPVFTSSPSIRRVVGCNLADVLTRNRRTPSNSSVSSYASSAASPLASSSQHHDFTSVNRQKSIDRQVSLKRNHSRVPSFQRAPSLANKQPTLFVGNNGEVVEGHNQPSKPCSVEGCFMHRCVGQAYCQQHYVDYCSAVPLKLKRSDSMLKRVIAGARTRGYNPLRLASDPRPEPSEPPSPTHGQAQPIAVHSGQSYRIMMMKKNAMMLPDISKNKGNPSLDRESSHEKTLRASKKMREIQNRMQRRMSLATRQFLNEKLPDHLDPSTSQLPFDTYYFSLPSSFAEFVQFRDSVSCFPQGAVVALIAGLLLYNIGWRDAERAAELKRLQLADQASHAPEQDNSLPLHVIDSSTILRNKIKPTSQLVELIQQDSQDAAAQKAARRQQKLSASDGGGDDSDHSTTSTPSRTPQPVDPTSIPTLHYANSTRVTVRTNSSTPPPDGSPLSPAHAPLTLESRWKCLVACIHSDQLVTVKDQRLTNLGRLNFCRIDIEKIHDSLRACPYLANTYIFGTSANNRFELPQRSPPPANTDEKHDDAQKRKGEWKQINGKWQLVEESEIELIENEDGSVQAMHKFDNEIDRAQRVLSYHDGAQYAVRLALHPLSSSSPSAELSPFSIVMVHCTGTRYPRSVKLRRDNKTGNYQCIHWWNLLQAVQSTQQ